MQGLFVIGHILGENALVLVGAVLNVGILASHAFAQALGEHAVLVGIDELVLQRRGTSVDNENFHVRLRCLAYSAGEPEFMGAPPRTWTCT